MKKIYSTPVMSVETFAVSDVITVSNMSYTKAENGAGLKEIDISNSAGWQNKN